MSSIPSSAYGRIETKTREDLEPRCEGDGCNRMLARRLTRPWVIDCPNCKHRNERD